MQTLWALIPALISFFLGSIYQSYRAARSEAVAQINDLINEVRSAQEIGSQYWAYKRSKDDKIKELNLRGSTFLIAQYVSQADDLMGHHKQALERKTDDLIDLLTGGSFETISRKADFERAIQIKTVAAEIVLVARKARLDVVAVSAVFRDLVRPPKRIVKRLHHRFRLF